MGPSPQVWRWASPDVSVGFSEGWRCIDLCVQQVEMRPEVRIWRGSPALGDGDGEDVGQGHADMEIGIGCGYRVLYRPGAYMGAIPSLSIHTYPKYFFVASFHPYPTSLCLCISMHISISICYPCMDASIYPSIHIHLHLLYPSNVSFLLCCYVRMFVVSVVLLCNVMDAGW